MPAGEALVDATDPLPPSLLGPRLIVTYPISVAVRAGEVDGGFQKV